MATKLSKQDLEKSINVLENVSKAQLFHTPSDSEPASWAGSSLEKQDSMDETAVADEGTDYDGVRKSLALKVEKSMALTPAEVSIAKGEDPTKAIVDKIRKGETLTPAETWAVSKSFKGLSKARSESEVGASDAPASNSLSNKLPDGEKEAEVSKAAKEDEDEEEKDEKGKPPWMMDKSFMAALNVVNDNVRKSLDILISRIDALEGKVAKSFDGQGSFNKSLGEVVVGIGRVMEGTAETVQKSASMPVRGPSRGNTRQGTVIEKSFGQDEQTQLSKGQISEKLVDLVKAGEISDREIFRFETSGTVSPLTQQKLLGRKAQ